MASSYFPWRARTSAHDAGQVPAHVGHELGELRLAVAEVLTEQRPADASADPVTTSLTSERHRELNRALAQITNDQRTAIVLYDVEGYDYQEIADMTGVSIGTVKSRIHRGRLALRGLLLERMDLFRG